MARSGPEIADEWLKRHVWAKAKEKVKQGWPWQPYDAPTQLDAFRAAVEAAEWSGVAGKTDKSILLAIWQRAKDWGVVTPNMSYREIAEVTRRGDRTVERSIRRLRQAVWLCVVERGDATMNNDTMEVHRRGLFGGFREIAKSRQMATPTPVPVGGVTKVWPIGARFRT